MRSNRIVFGIMAGLVLSCSQSYAFDIAGVEIQHKKKTSDTNVTKAFDNWAKARNSATSGLMLSAGADGVLKLVKIPGSSNSLIALKNNEEDLTQDDSLQNKKDANG